MNKEIKIPNNLEIDTALKDFETKYQAEQALKTPEVQQASDVPKMVQLVMKWFGFKEQKQAEYVLLGFVVMAIGISLFLVFWGTKNTVSVMPINVDNIDQSKFLQ